MVWVERGPRAEPPLELPPILVKRAMLSPESLRLAGDAASNGQRAVALTAEAADRRVGWCRRAWGHRPSMAMR